MVEPLRHHKYSRKTIFRPKIVPGLHSLVVPSVMWLVLNGTSGHMGSDGAKFDQNITWCFEFGPKRSRNFLVRVNSVQIQVYVLITLPRFITFCILPRIEVWYFWYRVWVYAAIVLHRIYDGKQTEYPILLFMLLIKNEIVLEYCAVFLSACHTFFGFVWPIWGHYHRNFILRLNSEIYKIFICRPNSKIFFMFRLNSENFKIFQMLVKNDQNGQKWWMWPKLAKKCQKWWNRKNG